MTTLPWFRKKNGDECHKRRRRANLQRREMVIREKEREGAGKERRC